MNQLKNFSAFLLIGLMSCSQQKEEQEHWKIDPVAFGLERISDGYDSLQIRVWYATPMAIEMPVVTIKRSDGKWTGTIRKIIRKPIIDSTSATTTDKLIYVPFIIKYKHLSPRSSWESVLRRMTELKLFDLPEMAAIPNLDDGIVDGASFAVEIATSKEYRTYSYHSPEHFMDEFWQARNMVDILDLIDSEFDVPWNWARDHWRIYRSAEEFDLTADSIILRTD